ncbi:hypothetical protein RD792_000248 [Penstemon davidsonii]|uniref:MADS-box domain-containing protein n=1 Tax=Penstemon davidsonii TaxID=160366 RepID=A0ABR0DVC8_9LAMI|nr:hypothetical protein RD792_000248 [Penstemon davidsonii]
MTRKKVTLKFMSNVSERKVSLKKRKKGLIKKVTELSILCNVDACAIIYSPFESQPEVWPSPEGTTAMLSRFMSLPEMEQTRKMANQESFTLQRIEKVKDQLRRLQNENKRKEVENFMYKCIGGMKKVEEFDISDAVIMNSVMQQTLSDINARMKALQIANSNKPVESSYAPNVVTGFGSGSAAVVVLAEPNVPPPTTRVATSYICGDENKLVDMRNKLASVGDFSELPDDELSWMD